MSLVTLSGVISAVDLNNNFKDQVSNIQNANSDGNTFLTQFRNVDVKALTTALTADSLQTDFVNSDDMLLETLGLSIFNPDATTRTASLTLTAVDAAGNTISKYLPNPITISATAAALAEVNAVRTSFLNAYLLKGVTYRLTLLRVDANAGVITKAQGVLVCQPYRRYV